MKIGIAVSTPDAVFSALALKGDYAEIFARISEFGYDGAELAVRDPALVDLPALKSLLAGRNLCAPAVGTGRAFGEEGLCFSSRDDNIRSAAVERIKSQIDFCRELGAHVIIGLILGKEEKTPESEKLALECMIECAKTAGEKNVGMVIEPINRYETSFITNVEICMDFIEKTGSASCGMLFDTFHANIEEASIEGSIRLAGSLIRHVHIADSNRRHAGAGHIDFASVIAALEDIGYDGFLSAEILPLPDPLTAARKNAEFLKKALSRK